MAAAWRELIDRLCTCNEAQLIYVQTHLGLKDEFLERSPIAKFALQIVKLLQQRVPKLAGGGRPNTSTKCRGER